MQCSQVPRGPKRGGGRALSFVHMTLEGLFFNACHLSHLSRLTSLTALFNYLSVLCRVLRRVTIKLCVDLTIRLQILFYS